MESSNLIRTANEFLDSINLKKEIEDYLKSPNKEKQKKLIDTLKENLNFLQNLKNKMEFHGFGSPYRNIGKLKGDSESLEEIATYSSYLKRIATEKKSILERVKHSVVAHKLAIGHILDEKGNKRILLHLPLDGSYKKELTDLPAYLISTYKDFLSLINPKGKGILTSYTISFLTFKDGKREFKREKVENKNYEKYLKEKYGNIIITSIKRNYSKNKIIDDQYVRKVLTISYLKGYKDIIENEINKRLDKILTKEEKEALNKYQKIMEKYSYDNYDIYSGILDVRSIEEKKLKEMEIKEILENEGLYINGYPSEILSSALEKKEKISKEVAKDILLKEFSKDIFNFYLYKTPDERTRSYLFPSIMITPEKGFLYWMKLDDDIKPDEVLSIKFILENELPKYQIPLKNLGGVALYLVHGWDKVEKYGFKKKEIEELLKKIALIEPIKELLKDKIDIKKLEKYGKVKKEKTKKFLDLLKTI